MKDVEVIFLQGRGMGIIVKGFKSKREREYIKDKILRASMSYRRFYRLRKCVGL